MLVAEPGRVANAWLRQCFLGAHAHAILGRSAPYTPANTAVAPVPGSGAASA